MTKQLIITVLTAIVLIGCKTETKKTEVVEPIVEAKTEAKIETIVDYQLGSQVPNDLVCMVNDAYMGKPQMAVPVNGKTYYGCCQMCVNALNTQEEARIGIDPYTQNPVDKTEAYIVLINNEGGVAYFESEQNYQKFSKRTQ